MKSKVQVFFFVCVAMLLASCKKEFDGESGKPQAKSNEHFANSTAYTSYPFRIVSKGESGRKANLYHSYSTDGVNFIGDFKFNNSIQSTIAPTAITFNGTAYTFYKGSSKLYYSTSSDGTYWNPGVGIASGGRGSVYPVVWQGALYLFYDSGNGIAYLKSTDGVNFIGSYTIPFSANSPNQDGAPNGEIMAFSDANGLWIVKSNGTSTLAYVTSSPSFSSWRSYTVPGGPAKSYGAASLNNTSYLAFRPYDGKSIYYSSFNGSYWSDAKKIPDAVAIKGPTLASTNGRLAMVYVGRTGADIYCTYSDDGINWPSGDFKAKGSTKDIPWVFVY